MYVLGFFYFFFFFFVILFFSFVMIFDDAIYLFIYFLHFISMLLRPSPILKTIQQWAREMKTKKKHFTTANK